MFLPRERLNENNKSLKILPHYNDYKQMTNLRNVRLSFNELPVVLLFFR